jgi:hypothetical protein
MRWSPTREALPVPVVSVSRLIIAISWTSQVFVSLFGWGFRCACVARPHVDSDPSKLDDASIPMCNQEKL